MNLRRSVLLLSALLPLLLGFSSKPKYTITFHAEADEMDPRKTMFPMQLEGRSMMFKIIPEISQVNVAAFHPFDSTTGPDKGVALQLDFRGSGALEMVTRTRQGQILLAMVNGKPVDYVVIDQVITNGLITIWQGVSDETIKQMDKKLQRIKPGGPPSMHKDMEMIPATEKEKKRSLKEAKEAEKAAEKAAKSGKPVENSIPSLSVPRANPSAKLPVEGGTPSAPPSPGPTAEPPLPRP